MFKYILDFLRTRKLPPGLAPFSEDPNLWRALRDEAVFFALDDLIALLNTTYECSPDKCGGKGVLHWLGTKKDTEPYVNPYRRGDVGVTGWVDSVSNMPGLEGYSDAKETFVQYRPQSKFFVKEVLECGRVFGGATDTLTLPNSSNVRHPIVVDLRKVRLSPNHFSLRYGGSCVEGRGGMQGTWKFEGSIDGESWTLLHLGRESDEHELKHERFLERERQLENVRLVSKLRETPEVNRDGIHCDYMETHYRHTWEIVDIDAIHSFYRYFRIIGADPPSDEGKCLHCIGLEIYGRVHEE